MSAGAAGSPPEQQGYVAPQEPQGAVRRPPQPGAGADGGYVTNAPPPVTNAPPMTNMAGPPVNATGAATSTSVLDSVRDRVRWGPIWAGLITTLPAFLILELLA